MEIQKELSEVTRQAELDKITRQLNNLRRKRPAAYKLIMDVLALPQTQQEEYMRQIMPILKNYMS